MKHLKRFNEPMYEGTFVNPKMAKVISWWMIDVGEPDVVFEGTPEECQAFIDEQEEPYKSRLEIDYGREKFGIGARVQVSNLSGVDSNKKGTVVSPRMVKTDGRGIPTNISGAYKPVDWKKEVAVQLDDGELITMFKSRLRNI